MVQIFDIPESQFVERVAQDTVDPVCAQLHLISTCTLHPTCYIRYVCFFLREVLRNEKFFLLINIRIVSRDPIPLTFKAKRVAHPGHLDLYPLETDAVISATGYRVPILFKNRGGLWPHYAFRAHSSFRLIYMQNGALRGSPRSSQLRCSSQRDNNI